MLIKNKRSLFSKTIALYSDRRSHDRQTTKRRETMTTAQLIICLAIAVYLNRKQCMVKRYSCLFTAILITFLILAVSLSICFTVNADQEKPKRHAYKYYTDIVIQKGESLWDIANEHMTEEYDSPKTYIKEVKSINSLTDVDKIYAGQRIVIPYYSTELK